MESPLNIEFVTAQSYIEHESSFAITHTLDNCLLYLRTHKEYGIDTETTGLDPYTSHLLLLIIGDQETKFVIDCTTIDIIPLKDHLESRETIKIGQNLQFDYRILLRTRGIRIENIFDCGLAYQVLNNGRVFSWSLPTQLNVYFGIEMSKEERMTFTKLKKSIENGNVVHFTTAQIEYAAKDVHYLPKLKQFLIEGRNDPSLGPPINGLKDYGLETVTLLENRAALAFADIQYNGFYLDPIYWMEELIPFYIGEKQRVLKELDRVTIDTIKQLEIDNGIAYSETKKHIPDCTQIDIFGNPSKHLKATKSGNTVSKSKSDKKQASSTGFTGINWNSAKKKTEFLKGLGVDVKYKDVKQGRMVESSNKEVLYRYATPEVKLNIEQKDYDKAAEYASNVFDYMLLYTTVSKIIGTYGASMLEYINPITGRIHSEINQLGAETGRISGKNPNLLNIPKQQRFRNGFRAQKNGSILITLDYSGVELRIIAGGSKEKVLVDAFNNNEDVHSKMGTIAYGIPVSKKENTKYRDQIKNVNFAIAYGATAKSDKVLKAFASPEEAEAFLIKYFKTFPRLKAFFDAARDAGMKNGYCTTFPPFNRIRWFGDHRKHRLVYDRSPKFSPEWKEASKNLNAIGREAMNTPIQGSSADMMKLAMVYIRDWIRENNLWNEILMVNQVYDELSFEVLDSDKASEYAIIIKDFMIKAGAMIIKPVVMEVEYEINEKWQK
jgi:DNA polymerase I-like protein with 3'-5' exonuclease and polymerase domains